VFRALIEGVGAVFFLPVSERKSAKYRWVVLTGFVLGLAVFGYFSQAGDQASTPTNGVSASNPPEQP
jgi:hypothetical protein